MNSVELIDKKAQLKNQAEALLSKAQSEQRKLNEGEESEFNTLKMQMAEGGSGVIPWQGYRR